MGTIYKITNKINGKSYIGLTTRNPETRFYEYRYHSANFTNTTIKKTLITKVIHDCGIENFDFEVIETNIPNEILDEKEIFYIAKYDTFKNGYNLTEGGRPAIQSVGRKNAKPVYQLDFFTFEIIDYFPSVSEAAKELGVGATQISNICNKKEGYYTSGNFTFCFAKEYDRAAIENHMKKQKGIKNSSGVEVYYLDNNELIDYYHSYTVAAQSLSLNAGNFMEYLNGKRKTAGKINERAVGVRYLNNDEANVAAELKRQAIIITNVKAEELKFTNEEDIYWDYKLLYDVLTRKREIDF